MGRCRHRRAEKGQRLGRKVGGERSSSRMPLATAKAITSGTAAPPTAKAARPASRPAWVPPLEVAWTTADGWQPAPALWSTSSTKRGGEPHGTDAVLPPIGMANGRRPAARSSPASASLALSSSPSRRSPVVRLGPEQRRQELVACRPLGCRAAEHEVDVQAEPRSGRRGHAAVVRLAGADGDQGVGTLGESHAAEMLELAGLVAAHPQARQVVALHPEPGTAGQQRPSSSGVGSVASAAAATPRRRPSGARPSRRVVGVDPDVLVGQVAAVHREARRPRDRG